ncbi:MAG: serine/threonine protein kinase [Roseburia sp.]|nr:serine/threonine protein kinase [Roseburia sp.]MCM1242569.1 serine/threonine protein kinase [Roseburia sp.]
MDKILAGKYEFCRILGEGGSSIVYLAWDKHMERYVAIKALKDSKELEEETQKKEALKKERELLKSLKHPMLPAVYDYFWEDGQYLVMEYIQGDGLHNYIEREGTIPEKKACEWGMQLLGLLSYLHTRNPPVIYRDLKPENIIVCADGSLRLVDFGAAFFIQYHKPDQDDLAGTIGYAAPEQFGKEGNEDGRADERSDIYTFGATLYHMLTGYNPSLPPCGIRPVRYMNPLLTPGIEQIVGKCTQPEPQKRYQSVEEVRRAMMSKESLVKRRIFIRDRTKDRFIIRTMEQRIRLTEKKTIGLFLSGVVVFGILAAAVSFTVKGREAPLPVTLYNTQGQKVLIRYGSVYEPEGNLLFELERELFERQGMQELSISLTDCESGERRERIFYIRGSGVEIKDTQQD